MIRICRPGVMHAGVIPILTFVVTVAISSPAVAQSTGDPRDTLRPRADSLAKTPARTAADSAKLADSIRAHLPPSPKLDSARSSADSVLIILADTAGVTDSTSAADSARQTVDTVRDSAAAGAVKASGTPRGTPKKAAGAAPATAAADPKWPVDGPPPMHNSLLPGRRIIAYYGNPLSRRMGILGELPPDSMLKRLDAEVAAWTAADSATPAKPALHLIAVVAQAGPGSDGKYRLRMSDSVIEQVAKWAETRNALVFLDVQIGLSTVEEEVKRLEKFLKRPNFHLGLDPEFAMLRGGLPGKRIGTLDAKQINWTVDYLADLVDKHGLVPKVLVVHRFTQRMLTNADQIELDPRVQVVIQMDGWGPPRLKRDSYRSYIWKEPVQFTGFKIFYKHDTRAGDPLMKPEDVLKLEPRPLYIQYQ